MFPVLGAESTTPAGIFMASAGPPFGSTSRGLDAAAVVATPRAATPCPPLLIRHGWFPCGVIGSAEDDHRQSLPCSIGPVSPPAVLLLGTSRLVWGWGRGFCDLSPCVRSRRKACTRYRIRDGSRRARPELCHSPASTFCLSARCWLPRASCSGELDELGPCFFFGTFSYFFTNGPLCCDQHVAPEFHSLRPSSLSSNLSSLCRFGLLPPQIRLNKLCICPALPCVSYTHRTIASKHCRGGHLAPSALLISRPFLRPSLFAIGIHGITRQTRATPAS